MDKYDLLQQALVNYSRNADEPEFNYILALMYEELGQTSAAIGFYLRTAERTKDVNLTYECLLKIGLCFEKQTRRNNTVRVYYKHAIILLPKRPEAYFLLSRHYERIHDKVSGYLFAEQGLQNADHNQKPLRGNVEYPGYYGLLFEKMVCSWWWGKVDECRELLRKLRYEYINQMDDTHKKAVENNINTLGLTADSFTVRKYDNSQYDFLRRKVYSKYRILGNYSQVYQDLFVLSMQPESVLNVGGKYLEIGSAGPVYGNNTKLLEELGWVGVGIEWNTTLANEYKSNRKNKIINKNALDVDYISLLSELAPDGIVNYLQLDCEPARVTFEIMKKIPFNMFKFGVITYEHDDYVDMDGKYRSASREFLSSRGYQLIVSDISPDGVSNFEDWWVHPDLVDVSAIPIMRDISPRIKHATEYMLPGLI